MMSLTVIQIVVLAVVVVAAVIDVRTKKIFNWLTFPSMLVGIVLNFVVGGVNQGLMAIGGCLLGGFVMVLPDPRKKMGYGDVKLMMAIGAFLGPTGVLLSWGYFALIYGLLAMLVMAKGMKSIYAMGKSAAYGLQAPAEDQQKLAGLMKSKLPLGPAIALGTIVAIWLEKPTLQLLGIIK